MTTELEQEFYDTFGIEKIKDFNYCNGGIIEYYLKYPDITAEKLLEMICIYNEYQNNCDYLVVPINIKTFKDDFLKIMIKNVNDKYMNKYFCNDVNRYKTEIQQLFKD